MAIYDEQGIRCDVWYANAVDGGWLGYQLTRHETGETIGEPIDDKGTIQEIAARVNDLEAVVEMVRSERSCV